MIAGDYRQTGILLRGLRIYFIIFAFFYLDGEGEEERRKREGGGGGKERRG